MVVCDVCSALPSGIVAASYAIAGVGAAVALAVVRAIGLLDYAISNACLLAYSLMCCVSILCTARSAV